MSEQQPFILLIDDDEDDLHMLSTALRLNGIAVRSFQSSELALQSLTIVAGYTALPSLIIIDYNMPVKNGQEVLKSITNNVKFQDIPVVIYSTHMSKLLRMQLMEDGAKDCFEKAWNCKELKLHADTLADLAFSYRTGT